MANEDIKKFRRRASKQNVRRNIRDYSIEIISAVIVGLLVTILVSYFSSNLPFLEDQPEQIAATSYVIPAESSQPTNRSMYMRAKLSQVLSHTSIAKIYITEYVMATGEPPKNIEDIGLSSTEFEEVEEIKLLYLTAEGGVGVVLSDDFGDNKLLVLQPKVSKGGSTITWRCETNVEKEYLGIPKMALCKHNASLKII